MFLSLQIGTLLRHASYHLATLMYVQSGIMDRIRLHYTYCQRSASCALHSVISSTFTISIGYRCSRVSVLASPKLCVSISLSSVRALGCCVGKGLACRLSGFTQKEGGKLGFSDYFRPQTPQFPFCQLMQFCLHRFQIVTSMSQSRLLQDADDV